MRRRPSSPRRCCPERGELQAYVVARPKVSGAAVSWNLLMARRGTVLVLLVAIGSGCAPKEDVTPAIVVSPGVKERIMVMDRFRHHGSPRRLLPRVTVEEVDEADLPPASADEDANEDDATTSDGGAPSPEVGH